MSNLMVWISGALATWGNIVQTLFNLTTQCLEAGWHGVIGSLGQMATWGQQLDWRVARA